MIDNYCERTADGLFNEPLNAITNLAFFIAGFLLLRLYRGKVNRGDSLLIVHLFLIGSGSLLFHTFANTTTLLLDVIPILSFQLIWLWLVCIRIFKVSALLSSVLTVAYLGFSFIVAALPDPSHGSIGYLAPLTVIASLGILMYRSHTAGAQALLLGAGIFTVSLTLRSVDQALCTLWAVGTHFIWHCLNAVVLYLCASVVLEAKRFIARQ